MKLKEILAKLETRIPVSWQESWDHCGVNLGSLEQDISSVLFSYDVCREVVQHAKDNGCDLIVSHHPFRMRAEVSLDLDAYEGRLIRECIQNNIALLSFHTNHDASPESLNHHYLNKLGLKDIKPLVLHEASTPDQDIGLGAWGTAAPAFKKQTLQSQLKDLFGCPAIRWVDSGQNEFQKIGICTGSGSSFLGRAFELDLDLFITGDMKYHQAIEAKRHDLAVADVGHFYSECDSVRLLKTTFAELFAGNLKYDEYQDLSDAFEFL